jgi:hypothetical protein
MFSEVIPIKNMLRRMRGGSQAFLVEGEDSNFYVAKFAGNPQGNRTLINEWITHHLFQQLGSSAPSLRVLRLTEDTKGTESLQFLVGSHRTPIQGVLHLGSQCPVDPITTAIFDFLPSQLLPKVVNLTDLATAFVVDRWLGQTDDRQAIFIRDRTRGGDLEFRLYLIDNGMSFGGKLWQIGDSARYGLYMDRSVYSILNLKDGCEGALSTIDALPENELYAAAEDIPSCWFSDEDYDALAKLLALLNLNRSRLRPLVSRHLHAIKLELNARSQQLASTSSVDAAKQGAVSNISLVPELC